ncbi:hypothetical protein OAE92_01060 [Akkermansiaceae bacterium]|jgi:hypothetical protein|nr:hypothetical protein [bacterium]MDB4687355.1 hypothetical protein [Akkermansiaceae bacterium]
MNQKERQLLREEIGDAKPDLCLRSKARIDTGRWWRRSPLWLCVVSGQLIMLSVGRRRYSARLPISSCGESHYNHATGEFVIVPGEELKFRQFSLSPREALELLRHLKILEVTNSSES